VRLDRPAHKVRLGRMVSRVSLVLRAPKEIRARLASPERPDPLVLRVIREVRV